MASRTDRLPDVLESTREFERWASHHVKFIPSDVRLKHKNMARAAFPFLRATFYRWAQLWPKACPELFHAPRILAIGDLHVENFGTWRDLEGRLIWGVNDFDEAWPAPYTNDLVRLLTSAYLAMETFHLTLGRKRAAEAFEEGYRASLASGGGPFVLAEHHRWLRLLAMNELRDPVIFWKRLEAAPKYKAKLPVEVLRLIRSTMPLPNLELEYKSRIAGLGSLGHPRVVALGTWHRAHVAREAKQLTPSAWIWAGKLHTSEILGRKLVNSAVRIRDPHVHFAEHWVVRRLAPDSSHIEMEALPQERDQEKILHAMGWETGNIHLGSVRALRAVRRDLAKRRGNWLHKAAKVMLKLTLADWKVWRKAYRTV